MEAWSTRRRTEVEFLPERDPKAEAAVLARKAGDDMKAMLGLREIAFEYTHDLHRLITEVTTAVGEFPFDTPEVVALTEHAVPLRYDQILDTEPLDRQAVVRLVEEVGEWAARQ